MRCRGESVGFDRSMGTQMSCVRLGVVLMIGVDGHVLHLLW
jgi:hypothetical protein